MESIVDCAFSDDDFIEDISLLYVSLWEIDGYSDCVEVLDGMNKLFTDSSEDSQLLTLHCFLGLKL